MFYDPREKLLPESLNGSPFNALVAPRPVAWISTLSAAGHRNFAPFSYYNGVSADPPMVMFSISDRDAGGSPKRTLANIKETSEFVVNVASQSLARAMCEVSGTLPSATEGPTIKDLQTVGSVNVRPPRIAGVPAALECAVYRIVQLQGRNGGRRAHIVVGEVVGIFIRDDMIVDGRVCHASMRQLGLLGYSHYLTVESVLSL
jgi:flavin reductase (DIM6/NTAB) family NADH-FMN oxidoreductase RutF